MDPQVEAELAPFAGDLLGLLPPGMIRRVALPRPSADVIAGYKALPDLTSVVADILDELGFDTAIPGGRLAPLAPEQRIVGPAVTVRQARVRRPAGHGIAHRLVPRLGGLDQVTLSRPGDVLVIDAGGADDASSFGGLMATAVHSRGLAGVVVDGCVRDAESMRRMGLSVWSRGLTPRTGKHRLEIVEFNGVVEIGGTQVLAGDLLLGDRDGLIAVPAELAEEVLRRAQAATAGEKALIDSVQRGDAPRDSMAVLPPEKW
ncbi:regulator of RNase E activity RraA [Azospirillum agricola]|uniref:RraA family protein n=1 Tax=Azospirillum agricola TaxID=1720247 RepID=UPI001AE33B30|nr:RraA family protein [Azospirillum agricola]MBP2228650.1 regulator of RNase E activity RraA [Azospirillum agricola]